MDKAENLSPLKRAIIEIRELRAQLDELQSARNEPIAIIGMGLRLPGGAYDATSYWRLLRDGVDAISQVPHDRWDIDAYYDPDVKAPGKMTTRWGGFIAEVDKFDPPFFGISPREAMSMDPQQRLLLQVSWEALENAGQAPDKLVGSNTGVFAGICSNDYFRIVFDDATRLDTFSATGNVASVAAGRLSYLLGLHGPNMAIDTACSSSLVAVHLAMQSLRRGDCRLALAAGVNLILLPEININFSKSQMMAADGRCKTFDARADGYVRGEGCVVIALKRLADAQKDGDQILALVRGSAINHDGKSSGLTAPNGTAQEAVIREALADARVAPREIGYVETHGTGTSLGDPIEVRALGAAYAQSRTAPLAIGSVKTNIGHLEAAAGLAGLVKVVLMLQHGEIPPHLHFETPNPLIPWNEFPLTVPTRLTTWESHQRFAGTSSFGFSGTNAHVILEQAPTKIESASPATERPLHLLTLSAKNDHALRELAERYATQLTESSASVMANVAFTANAGRAHFTNRLAIVAESTERVRTQLDAYLAGKDQPGILRGRATIGEQPQIVFLFTGHGSHYVNMGRQLFETQPTYRNLIEQCDELLRPYLEHSLISVLYPSAENNLLDDMTYGQPAMFAVEYALASLWRAWGIEPAVVAGHSIGEYVAACVAGVFSLADALKLVAMRGRLMQELPADGEMITVFADEARVAPIVAPYAAHISIAAINSPETVVISGQSDAMNQVLSDLHAQKIKTRKLPIARAAHSPMVEPMIPFFVQADAGVKFSSPQIAMVSTVTGKPIGDEITQPDYWRRHLRQAVRFVDAMQTLQTDGYRHWLELGPNPALISLGQRCMPDAKAMRWLPSLRASWADWQVMLESLATLYVDGATVNWEAFDRDYARQKISLPTYPFERKAYWWTERRGQALGHSSAAIWEPIVQAARQQANQAPLDLDLSTYAAKWDVLNRLTDGYVNNTFVELGAFARTGESHSLDSLLEQHSILLTYRNLLRRWLDKMVALGLLRQSNEAWVSVQPLQKKSLDALWLEAREKLADVSFLIDYVRDCGEQLAKIVTGKISPLETLFPGGAMMRAESLYQDWSLAQYYNQIVRAAIESATRGKNARVIEVGAGSGATTSAILPALHAQVQYYFTDVSELFLSRAQAKLRAFPIVHYGLLNIEQDPHGQGYARHSFDAVVAANVLHATQDLKTTLQNVLALLAPNGTLVLYEVTTHQSWFDMTTGLIEGWQSFGDALRAASPLLAAEQWQTLLRDAGFDNVVILPEAGSSAKILSQSVILARAPSNVVAEEISPEKPNRVVVPVQATPTTNLIEQLQNAFPDERHEMLVNFVRAQVAQILRMDASDTFDRHQRLMDLGVDSLMAVELRGRLSHQLALARALPATLIFDYPTVEAIAEYLARDVLVFDQPTQVVSHDESSQAMEIEQLSDEQVEALLLKKLKDLG